MTVDATEYGESTFDNELMTGFVSAGGMPLSAITAGSLVDMGYVVNPFAIDPFQVPSAGAESNLIGGGTAWEKPLGRVKGP